MQRPTIPLPSTVPVRNTRADTLREFWHTIRVDPSVAHSEVLVQSVCAPTITPTEIELVAQRVGSAAGDPQAALVAVRMERQIRLVAASANSIGVLVARSRRAKEPGGLDLQIAAVLAAIHTRLGEAPRERPLIVLAHAGLISRLRQLLAPSARMIAGVVAFEVNEDTSATIQILESTDFVDDFDQRLASVLKTATILKPDPGQPKRKASSLRIGELFDGKYQIVRRLGGGGFGDVYEAEGKRLKNRVAIKVLRSDAAELGTEQLDAFRDEAVRLTKLEHAHIVNLKFFDEAADGTLYLVMEYVDGQELDKVLKQAPGRRLSPRRVQKLLLQMLDGLRAAHDVGDGQGILHLDLKPNNVFVVPGRAGEDHVKLIDFGIGQFVGGDATQSVRTAAPSHAGSADLLDAPQGTITLGRLLLGTATVPGLKRVEACTPEYAAPELGRHVLGDADIVPLDGRADLYSLGIMAFQMLTGRLPFPPVDSRFDVVRQHVVAEPEKVGASGVRVPRDLARFIDKLMARDRDQRWKSADEAWRELDAIVHPPAWKLGLRVGAVVIVLAALTAWFTRPESRTPVQLWSIRESGDPIDTDREPIHFGPDRTSARIRLDAPGVDWAKLRGVPLRLEDLGGGTLPASWSIAWSNGDRTDEVLITHDGSDRVRVPVRARIAGEFGDLWMGEGVVQLVWLGADAWSIEQLRAGEFVLEATTAQRVDPEDLALTVRLAGSGLVPADIDRATLDLGAGSPAMNMSVVADPSGGLRGSVDLPSPWPSSLQKSIDATVTVIDRAGTTRSATRKLAIVTEPLELQASLLDAARSTDAKPVECVRAGAGYLLSPGTRPVLVARSRRPVTFTTTVRVNSEQPSAAGQVRWSDPTPEAGLYVYKAELEGLIQRLGEGDVGQIDLTALESDTARSSRTRRGSASATIQFAHSKDSASLSVHADRGRLEPDVWYTNAATLALQLFTESEVPVLARWRLRAPPDGRESEWREVTGRLKSQTGSRRSEALEELKLSAEGTYELEVHAYRTFGGVEDIADEPDSKTTYKWIVARTAPRLGWKSGSLSGVIRSVADIDATLSVEVLEPGSGAPTSNLGIRLERAEEQGRTRTIASRPIRVGSPVALREIFDGTAPADGSYALVVDGIDEAGNAIEEAVHRFDISTSGPTFDALTQPLEGATWERHPTEQGWQVRVRLEDPNGIDLKSIRAQIQRVGDPNPKWRVEQSMRAEPLGAGAQRVVVANGLIPFDEDWSSMRVELTLEALDQHGTLGRRVYPPFDLGDARRVLPSRLARLDPPAPGPTMRLVRGNLGAVYMFGGRGDEVETDLYQRADLGPFKKEKGPGEGSFKLVFDDGAIEDYYLDEDEVTRAEFLAFVRAAQSGYLDPKHWPAGSRVDPQRHAQWSAAAADGSNGSLPITGVTWDEAAAFAHWMAKRLPSLVEWEYAVRDGARSYRPFSAWDPDRPRKVGELVNYRGSAELADRAPWPRGTGTESSSEGFHNLSGNIREWTSTPREIPGEPEVDLRALMAKHKSLWLDPTGLGERLKDVARFYVAGGAWDMQDCDFLTWRPMPRGEVRPNVGFRCAVSAAEVRSALGTRWGAAP